MREASETTWWRKTWQLAAAVVGGAFVLSLLALSVDGPAGESAGLPLGAFFAVIVTPLVLLIAIFVFANRQRALDRRYDVAED